LTQQQCTKRLALEKQSQEGHYRRQDLIVFNPHMEGPSPGVVFFCPQWRT